MVQVVTRQSDVSAIKHLMKAGLPRILAQTYAGRGINEAGEVVGTLRDLPSFKLLQGACDAASLLADAVATGERIVIVADYDADGATGCAVAWRCLKGFGAEVEYLIPHRQDHGYGLTPEIADLAAEREPKILMTVDNGIASVTGVARCRELGMSVIVTDHHLQADILPDANVIVNPNQSGCHFPSKNIAGVGVVWFVMKALEAELIRRGTKPGFKVDSVLSLVAVGTIADVVTLDYVNRTLIKAGLDLIRGGQAQSGLTALIYKSGTTPECVSTTDIAFMVAPRINAAGRLDSMDIGVQTLIEDDYRKASFNAQVLSDINTKRKRVELDMVAEAEAQLAADEADGMSIVAYHPNWHQGVVGIVAGRIKEKRWLPTIAFARERDGTFKGSGRSIPGLNIRDTLDRVSKRNPGVIVKFGGHAMAAGLTVAAGRLDAFTEAFEREVAAAIGTAERQQILYTDGELSALDINLPNAEIVEECVWGQNFSAPLFENEFRVKAQDFMKDKATGQPKHSKLTLELEGHSFSAVLFNFTETLGRTIRAVYQPSVNRYRGESRLQLRIQHFTTAKAAA